MHALKFAVTTPPLKGAGGMFLTKFFLHPSIPVDFVEPFGVQRGNQAMLILNHITLIHVFMPHIKEKQFEIKFVVDNLLF